MYSNSTDIIIYSVLYCNIYFLFDIFILYLNNNNIKYNNVYVSIKVQSVLWNVQCKLDLIG